MHFAVAIKTESCASVVNIYGIVLQVNHLDEPHAAQASYTKWDGQANQAKRDMLA